jgi:hypothetical protein
MEKLIPQQQNGKAIDATSTREFVETSLAQDFFKTIKQRLNDVNAWHLLAGKAMAKFVLVNADGQPIHRSPISGDHFKIDIIGPGTKEGDGYDWVRIESIQMQANGDSESYGFTVRPSPNPNKSTDKTAHFYSSESTSTFIVKREETMVTAEIHDRNTKPNDAATRTADIIRDAVVGTMGALTFSKIQWQRFTDGLVSDT